MLPECQLFGTLGCHLCEVAEDEIMPLVEHGLLVELVDITDPADLTEVYGLRLSQEQEYYGADLSIHKIGAVSQD